MIAAGSSIGTGIGGWCIASRVPCSLGVLSRSRSQASWSAVSCAVVVLRHAGVERHDPEAAHVVDPVLRSVVVGVEEALGVRRPLVVVAHHPDHLRAYAGRERLHQLAQPRVRRGLGLVGQVAGEDHDAAAVAPSAAAAPGAG